MSSFSPSIAVMARSQNCMNLVKQFRHKLIIRGNLLCKKIKVHPKLLKGCKNGGTIKFTMVLRKSGQVTNIALENDNGCESFQAEKIITSLEKTKFTPAIKNGVSVSELKIGSLQLNFL